MSINIKIRLFTSILCTQLVLYCVCTIGLLIPSKIQRSYTHWCASVLNKRFLTPFRDGIWNCCQVSVGDGWSFPHDPETVGDMPSWHTRSAK